MNLQLPYANVLIYYLFLFLVSLSDQPSTPQSQIEQIQTINLTCPANVLGMCPEDEPAPFTKLAAFLAAGGAVSSSCGIDSASFSLTSTVIINSFCPRTIKRTYFIRDSCGGVAECIQEILVDDNSTPSIICPSKLLHCGEALPARYLNWSAFYQGLIQQGGNIVDNCSIDTSSWQYVGEETVLNQNCLYTVERSYSIRDSCRNLALCIHSFVFIDNTAPSFNPARDTTLYAGPDCMVDTSVTNLGKITNLVDDCNMLTFSNRDVVKKICTSFDTIFRIWTVKDQCNNTTIDTQFIFVLDTSKPFITGPPGQTYLCASQIPPPDTAAITAIDNCSSAPLKKFVRDSTSDSLCLNNKVLHRIYTATDLCGNTARFIQTIRIKDSVPPILTCPLPITVECSSAIPNPDVSSVTATDPCDGTLRAIFVKDSVTNQQCVNQKIIFRIYSAADACNNISFCFQIITVNDQTPPSLTCPPDTLVSCISDLPPVDLSRVIASDQCSANVTVSFIKDSIANDICENKKTIYRIFQATDSCMNSLRCTQTILVNDNQAPVMTCPRDSMFDCMSEIPDPQPLSIPVSDNCSGPLEVIHLKDSITQQVCVNQKLIYRIYVATDLCLNRSRCIQLFTVLDEDAPIFIGPTNTDTLTCGAEFSVVIPTASDNCDDFVPVSTSRTTLDSICPGNYKIVYTFIAMDSCNNGAIRSDTITFLDDSPPSISCPPDLNECYVFPYTDIDSFLLHGGSISDLCGIDSNSFKFVKETIEDESGQIIIKRKYKISDLCGNSDTCDHTLLIDRTCVNLPALGDLALIKTVNSEINPYFAKSGGVVPICITIFNQGFVEADSIMVTDYFPGPGSLILTPGWIDNGNGTASILLSQLNGGLPDGGLAIDDSIKICYDIRLSDQFKSSVAINVAEISGARDTHGNMLTDLDSNLDNDPNNDTGGRPNTVDDNNVFGDSRLFEDEDDSDPALFYICQPLTCVNHLNASVDAGPGCGHCFKASELLTGSLLPDEFYTVTFYDSYGKKLPSNCIGREYLGLRLTYSVSVQSCSDNYCWGQLTLEDKSPPPLDCSNDTLYCFQLNTIPDMPIVQDNCSGPAKVSIIKEVWQDLGCQGGEIQGILTRTLFVKDAWNNSKTCEKKYYIRKINLLDVVCPSDITFECTTNTSILNPSFSGAPTIQGYALWPSNAACKLFVTYKDQRTELCGPGYKIVRTWIIGDHCTGQEIKCIQLIKVEDRTAPVIEDLDRNISLTADPHECYGILDLAKAEVEDCSAVVQSYLFIYPDPEKAHQFKTLSGKLPARIRVPVGQDYKIYIQITDECNHYTKDSIFVTVYDVTPPNPVCHETTQITLDPDSCWGRIIAKDLDNGSFDNCCSDLHFAVAYSSDIEAARKNFLKTLQDECGPKEYSNHKAWYDEYLEDWISCYVFKDSLDLNECGTQQVVLRVYQACNIPEYDPHVFPCSPHAWYCYNTSWRYRVVFNQAFNKSGASMDCTTRAPWSCKKSLISAFNGLAQYNIAYYETQDFPQSCDRLFGNAIPPLDCPKSLYNDCMIQLLADDKQKPYCDSLQDLEVYCDGITGAEYGYAWQFCGEGGDEYSSWPGPIRIPGDSIEYGYYGGSLISSHDEHQTLIESCGYDKKTNWQPIYCKEWLKLDRIDTGHKINPSELFYHPVIADKKHARRFLKPNEFLIADNCIIDSVTFKDNGTTNNCGMGWLQRTWTIKDKCGNQTFCTQKIVIKHRSDFEVLFPEDREVACTDPHAVHPDLTGKPIVSDDDCELVGIHFQDDTFYQVENACYKIMRTWTLSNSCSDDAFAPDHHFKHPEIIVDDRFRANATDRYCMYRNLKDNGDGILKYTQVIKVYDHTAPSIRCIDTTICYTGTGCEIQLNIPIQGDDQCAKLLWYDLAIDADQDGQFDDLIRNHVTVISGPFKPGKYSIKITASDHCGNITTCISTINIKDCKAPTPYCLNGVATVIMPSSGSIELWASDFNRGSTDNCTPSDKLIFSFDKAGQLRSKVFTCKDLPNGRSATLPLDIWVRDESGNVDFCRTYVLLQDNSGTSTNPGGVCADTTIALNYFTLKGNILTEEQEAVESVEVELNTDGQAYPMQITGNQGSYTYPGIPLKGNVRITPHRTDYPMNGVSTLDLLMIEKHIKGERNLSSPYKMIAADIDRSGDINVIDLLELRKLILGIYDVLPKSESWRFIPKAHPFTDPAHPFDYPMEMVVQGIDQDMKMDFTGIKVGDVNVTAQPHSIARPETREANSGLIFSMTDQHVQKNQIIEIAVSSPNFSGISGFQGTLHFEGLQYIRVEPKKLKFNAEHIGLRWADDHELTFSWQQVHSSDIKENETLFTLHFKVLKNLTLSDHVWIGSKHTVAESYEGNGEIKNLGLKFDDGSGRYVFPDQQLIQNYPNPFTKSTVIGIQLQHGGKGALRFYDLTGKQLKSIEKTWTAGYQEITVEDRDFPAAGIYFYTFESSFFNASRKMILKL